MGDYDDLTNEEKAQTRREALIMSDIFKILAEDHDLDPTPEPEPKSSNDKKTREAEK